MYFLESTKVKKKFKRQPIYIFFISNFKNQLLSEN